MTKDPQSPVIAPLVHGALFSGSITYVDNLNYRFTTKFKVVGIIRTHTESADQTNYCSQARRTPDTLKYWCGQLIITNMREEKTTKKPRNFLDMFDWTLDIQDRISISIRINRAANITLAGLVFNFMSAGAPTREFRCEGKVTP